MRSLTQIAIKLKDSPIKLNWYPKNAKTPTRIGVEAILFNSPARFFEQPSSREICLCRLPAFLMPLKFGTESILQDFVPRSRKNIEATNILHNLHVDCQVSTNKIGKLYQLKNLINQHKLSESLELLEKSGISGDFALFILQNIQKSEVA